MACSTVRAMTYRLQQKAAPLGGAAPQFGAPDVAAPAPEEEVEQHEWAGDLYEDGDETLPEEAFARLAGAGGEEEAWLDRAEDGTLTGWVRDTDGSVYRYSDADAWAVDVDQAQMVRDADPAVEEEPLEEDLLAEEVPGTNEGGVDPNAPVEELVEEEPEYDADGNLVETVVEDEFDEELVDEDDPEEDLDTDLEDEEEDEDDKKGAFLRKMQGKSLPGPGGLRYLVRSAR